LPPNPDRTREAIGIAMLLSGLESVGAYFRAYCGTMARAILIVVIACFCGTSLGPMALPALAKNKAELVDIKLGRGKGNLEVSFRIQDCFTPKMEEAIRSGVATTFRILLELEKPGFQSQISLPFLKSRLLKIALEHTIKYDLLNNEYNVYIPEHPDRILTTPDLEEAKLWMSSVRELPVIPLWRLKKNETYQLRMKAELSKFNLPLFFRYIFFFVSLWDFDTDWHKLVFSL
jgi:hypothetical protein